MKILQPVARAAFAKTALQQDAVLNKIASLLAAGHPWQLASCRQREKFINTLRAVDVHDALPQFFALIFADHIVAMSVGNPDRSPVGINR